MNEHSSTRLFLSPPHMGGDENRLVAEAFGSNYIAPLGPMVDAFEAEFAAYTGIPHCLALSSGTAATHLALREVLQRPEIRDQRTATGTERPLVLASTLTFIGSVTPAVFEGCDITFIDCDRESWNMDPALLEEELAACREAGRTPGAVIPTDLYGQPCDLPRIVEICGRYGVPVICDSAEAVGGRYGERDEGGKLKAEMGKENGEGSLTADGGTENGGRKNIQPSTSADGWRHAGAGAWASVYSFNGNKIITTSGGGMLASHDAGLIEHARKLSTQARDPAPHYQHSEIGFNYRMSNILAAIGRGQLAVLEDRVRRKREIFQSYRERLGTLPGISFMPEPAWSRANRWLTVILIDEEDLGVAPHELRIALEAENVEARPVWKPMHLQPVFRNGRLSDVSRQGGNGPQYEIRGGKVAEDLFRHGLCLPSGTAMGDSDMERVCETVRAVSGRK